MYISSTHASQSAAYSQQAAKPKLTPTSPFKSTGTDTVTLSDAGRKMYAQGSKVMMLGDHPVIVAPDDKGNYPTQEQLEADWDRLARVPESAQDLIPFATTVINEDMTLDPAREAAAKALTPQQQKDHSEYMFKVVNAFRDEYLSRGLTFIDYEEQTKTDFALREEIDLALRERLYADPRAVELMKEFGVSTAAKV